MLGTRFSLHLSRRAAALVGLAVALPALFLAGLGIFLTLRVARAIENDSIRYDTYIGREIGEALEQELMAGLRRSIALAENAARSGGTPAQHVDAVLQERLPGNPRLYGGFESTRKLSVQLLGPDGEEIGRLHDPGNSKSARTEPLSGPFERFSVRVSPTASSPVVWATNFVALEITFIGLLGLAIVLATVFGLRYTVRQLKLAQIKAAFVSNITHELKTPIALIRLAVETLEMRRINSPAEYET